MNIRKRLLLAGWLLIPVAGLAGGKEAKVPDLREGDIVFSGSAQGQGGAIMAATGSPYTHCGIVFERDGKLMVLEAVQPVGVVSLEGFMARSHPDAFTVRRLKTAVPPASYQSARTWATAQIGKNYDGKFLWDDGRLYCSELVWKIYQHAGVELCKPRRFRDYHLDDPEVRRVIEERHGRISSLPLDEKVVAPSDLAASPLLVKVSEGP